MICRGQYGKGTYKERGPGWRSDPRGGLRRGFGDLQQVHPGSRAVPRGATQDTIVGVQDREWVSCVLTRRRGGSWACQNPRRVGDREHYRRLVLKYPFSGVPQVYHSRPINHTNVRRVAKRRLHVI